MATPGIVPIGSYARGTLIPPGRDADVMFVWPDAPANAREALTRLHGLLAGRYTKIELRLQKHSVGIFYDVGPTLDVVPP